MWRNMELRGGKLFNHMSQEDKNSLNSLMCSYNSPKQQKLSRLIQKADTK